VVFSLVQDEFAVVARDFVVKAGGRVSLVTGYSDDRPRCFGCYCGDNYGSLAVARYTKDCPGQPSRQISNVGFVVEHRRQGVNVKQ
jgi:hypothetical protein